MIHSGQSSITHNERLRQKLKFCYFLFSFCIFLKNLCTRCEAVLYFVLEEEWENPDVNLPFAFTITKDASNDAVGRAIQGRAQYPRARISYKRRTFWNYHKLREILLQWPILVTTLALTQCFLLWKPSFVVRFVKLNITYHFWQRKEAGKTVFIDAYKLCKLIRKGS